MAQEEPEVKRFKHSIISDHVYSANLQNVFMQHWHNNTSVKSENIEVISEPFKVCKISNFLSNEDFMDDIKSELLDIKTRRISLDLYQYEQTIDFSRIDNKNLKLLYDTFKTDLASWMERHTKIKLNNEVFISSSCYSDTDYLLCHDDNTGPRRIAFILYLSKNWTTEDGGALDLFDTDEHGQPRRVVKSLYPEYNSLVFFEVVDNSYHQVAEVISSDKSRWTINGWFYGDERKSNRLPRPEVIVDYIKPVDSEVDLNLWITKYYLHPGTLKEVQKDLEQSSYILLSNFLREDMYKKLLEDLANESISWKRVGPADVRNYEIANEESLPEMVKDFYNMFKSISFFRLLKKYTELDLVPKKEGMNPKMTIELQRWSNGCYTLICDKSANKTGTTEKNSNENNYKDEDDATDKDRDTSNVLGVWRSLGEDAEGSQAPSDNECDKKDSSENYVNVNRQVESEEKDSELWINIANEESLRSKKNGNHSEQSSLSKLDGTSPQKVQRNLDTDDSDMSDIGDYLSDPRDCSLECSDQEGLADEIDDADPGSLDLIMQFHTGHVPEEVTIDYVDPRERDGALIHVPARDNHFCLVYKTLDVCRLHKYVNHYCKYYFYNLICTYYE